MKIAVLGSGNGGHAVAFEWAEAGHDVYMYDFPQFSPSIDAIAEAGGIWAEGEMKGFAKLAYAGSDIEKVLAGAETVFIVGPAYSTEAFAKACAPHVEEGQSFVVMPGSCMGAVTFKHSLGIPMSDDSISVSETSTLPYAVRVTGPARISIFNKLPAGYMIASLPRERNEEVYKTMKTVYKGLEKAESVFQTSLQNSNPVIHPAVTTLNAALIERTGGNFFFYNDGVTPAVGRLMQAVDDERMSIGRALGLKILSDPELGVRQGYMTEANYVSGYNQAPGFDGIKAQSSLDYRYYNEDVGYTMVFWMDLAKRIGVPTPTMEAMTRIVSIIMGRDYFAEAPRTLEKIGLGAYSTEDLLKL
ncbi:MAG TPA: NAD/NADP octopine/nopaline dehydrogenase family protein [Bacillota bacterium]|nr:NAD/NADP octopine/nopaline dehydrogenase family protein [Bacillota bacterium]